MKKLILFVIALSQLFAVASFACDHCSTQPTYPELCAQTFVSAGYSIPDEGFADMCSNIQSRPALECQQALVRNSYNNLNSDILSGCANATECGVRAVNAFMNNGYQNVTGDELAVVSGASNDVQADCMVSLFNQHYGNLTAENIRNTCF